MAISTFVGVEIALTTAYFLADGPWGRVATWAGIALAGVLAILIGVAVNRPARAREWRLLAAGAFVLGACDTASLVLRALERPDVQPLPIDLGYLGVFVLFMAGINRLSRSGVPHRDRVSLLDAVTLTIAGGLLFWIYLIAPRIEPGLPILDIFTIFGYPVGILLLVAMVVRLGVGTHASVSLVLFSTGLYALAIGEITYLLSALAGTWQSGRAADLWWVAYYLGWGTAALHPSMTQLGEPRLARSGELTPQRLILLALCAVIPNLVLIRMAIHGTVRYPGAVGAAGLLMVILVLARLFGVLRRQWWALAQERALRRAASELLGATDIGTVERVIDRTAAQLLRGMTHRTVLALGSWPDQAAAVVVMDPDRLSAYKLMDFEAVAVCRLSGGTTADLGRLLVAGDRARLARLTGVLEILAAQTGLAVARIRLSDTVHQREAEVYFQNMVYHSSDVILIIDENGIIRFRSPSAEPTFGDQSAVGRAVLDLLPADERPRAAELMNRLAAGDDDVPNDLEWHMHRRDGRPMVATASWRDLRGDPTVGGFVVTLRDVTEQRRLADELTHRAFHDPLTGLPNRELFSIEARKALHRSDRAGTVTGVLFLDLDDFKQVNDEYGHLAGDTMLREVANRLTRAVRKDDVTARLGGDEFAVLVPHAESVEQIESVAERVVRALAAPMKIGSDLVGVSGSLGVASTADSEPNALLNDADRALYQAKRDGKGRWRRLSP